MARLIINGGKKLTGVWRPSGNKNEVLPLLAASLLFKKGLILVNAPEIEDVKVMLAIARSLGVKIKGRKNLFSFTPSKKLGSVLPPEPSSKVRSSLLFLAPLLALHGRVSIPRSGGDKIGARKIDTHLEAFLAFGAKISANEIVLPAKIYRKQSPILVWLPESSVTATENALILAAARPAKTIIKNAACEPHVVGLGQALQKAGAQISGLGTNLLKVIGTENFKKVKHKISEDYMEIGSALVISAISDGQVKVRAGNGGEYQIIFDAFRKFGRKIIKDGQNYRAVTDKNHHANHIQILSDDPWPSFPSDLMSVMVVLATQSPGQFLFHEKMFESRLHFTDQLRALGAQLVLCDPHRVLIAGPSKLYGAHLVSPDIRAGMALVIAALAAQGRSVIDNIEQLDRGYENLEEKLKVVGADVKRE
ncbi:MAG: UDP-N-acetylglucosamine 1-carboxyvinyltransferase [Patescibacteria group bacterium]